MKRPKRAGKPSSIKLKSSYGFKIIDCAVQNYFENYFIYVGYSKIKLNEAKRLHSWLTKAIAYLEQEQK